MDQKAPGHMAFEVEALSIVPAWAEGIAETLTAIGPVEHELNNYS